MGVFGSIIEPFMLGMLYLFEKFSFGGTVAFELIGNNDARSKTLLLE